MATPSTTPSNGVCTLLERSSQLDLLDDRARRMGRNGHGRLILIAGEAGIGKTALVRAFCESQPALRVLWGSCDALHTPRPLGPLIDIADELGGELEAAFGDGVSPGAVVSALARELRGGLPAIVVLEDLHWADTATLDVLRMLTRRIAALPALVIATYRDDEVGRRHPLRVALGDLPASAVDRIALRPLSLDAVVEIAGELVLDHDDLHRRTAGNPFFVTEVLAAADADMPDTVRDAVLARVSRLDDGARMLLDAVAIVPQRAELWLLEALADGDLSGLVACLASGVLRAERDAVGFRHEIARVAVEEMLSPHARVMLHRKALATLAAQRAYPDPARLAHHAEAADDAEAVLRYAPIAGARAAQLGAHCQAAAQFERALRYADRLAPARRAELLEHYSYESYLTEAIDDATIARRAAMLEHRASGDVLREGDAHRWLSRLAWFAGDNATAEDEARLAIELLAALPPGRELAMAFSNMAQLRMLASDHVDAASWGARAVELAERLEETEILVHALNNIGTAGLMMGSPEGRTQLERSLALALEAGLEEHVARAHTNLGAASLDILEYAVAERHLDAGIAYCAERDLDSWLPYMSGHKARLELGLGRWSSAATTATRVLRGPDLAPPSRIVPLSVLGLLRARRGDPGIWPLLDEALRLARGTGELQRLAPVSVARAEARWLAGEDEQVAGETDAALALALAHNDVWSAGDLYVWRARAGIDDAIAPRSVAEPYALELGGDGAAAAARWEALGCGYDAALALAGTDDPFALQRSLDALQMLGARTAARRVTRALREQGVRDVRHGPRAATRENPAGLTARELEVLALVAEGLRNAEIAARLFLSEKTVAHHVSAILRKLRVRTRSQAGAEAARLGIVAR
jgi:predicted ATPase/DNA-binding CsgD family transcriptional regulator